MSQTNVSEFKNFKVEVEHRVATIYVDNAPANALSSETIRELSSCIDYVSTDLKAKAIILTGNGRFFVAGADIKEFEQGYGNEKMGEEMSKAAQAVFNKIENLGIPVIAAINGACLGGGLELAMSCHLRIAAKEAVLGLPELNLGLIPAFGGTQRLPRLTNKAKALELILLSKNINGEEAEALGIVNKSVEGDQVLTAAKEWANIIASKKSLVSVSATLKAVTKGLNSTLDEGLAYEAELFGQTFGSEDMKEGVSAFIEKRTPEFKDR